MLMGQTQNGPNQTDATRGKLKEMKGRETERSMERRKRLSARFWAWANVNAVKSRNNNKMYVGGALLTMDEDHHRREKPPP